MSTGLTAYIRLSYKIKTKHNGEVTLRLGSIIIVNVCKIAKQQ